MHVAICEVLKNSLTSNMCIWKPQFIFVLVTGDEVGLILLFIFFFFQTLDIEVSLFFGFQVFALKSLSIFTFYMTFSTVFAKRCAD